MCTIIITECLFLLFTLPIKPECTNGWYGLNCSHQCSGHCRDGVTCNPMTGQCDGGCNVGWTGVMCEKGKNTLEFSFFSFLCFFFTTGKNSRFIFVIYYVS